MRSVFRCFIFSSHVFRFYQPISTEILCKLNFVSLEFPKMGGCSSTINSSGRLPWKWLFKCIIVHRKTAENGRASAVDGSVISKRCNLVIKEGDKPDGYISGIGHLGKAGQKNP